MAFLGEAGEFGTLKVKAKRLVCGEIEEEVIELDLNRGEGNQMNRFLASIIGFLNGFIALVFILGGGAIGHRMSESYGLVLGLVCGLIVAILVCGFLAIFISMRAELVEIRRLIESRPI